MKLAYSFTLLTALIFLFTGESHAQYNLPQNNVWIMGDSSGLDFNGSGNPVAISSHHTISYMGSGGSVADSSGNLLFYTNGISVWDAADNIMPNGDSIYGADTRASGQFNKIAGYHSMQNVQIVPVPNQPQKYFVFTMKHTGTIDYNIIYANLVDMDLNNGQGDVDTTFPLRGIPIAKALGGRMVAIKDCSKNIWLVVVESMFSIFKSFKISNAGIDTVPVISDLNAALPNTTVGNSTVVPLYTETGTLRASQDGSKILMSSANMAHDYYYLNLFDFDPGTGLLSNPQVFRTGVNSNYQNVPVWDAIFSPSGNYFYALMDSTGWMEYCLQYPTYNTVPADQVIPDTLGIVEGRSRLRLGPDGKIYFISKSYPEVVNGYTMGRINYPDLQGAASGFQKYIPGIDFSLLNPPGNVYSGIPSEVVFPASALNVSISYRNDTLFAQPANYPTYQWYFEGNLIAGATQSYLPAQQLGQYSVHVQGSENERNHFCTDSVIFNITKDEETGINRSGLTETIQIYPNPTTDQLNIKTRLPVTIVVYNLLGQKLLTTSGTKTLNIASLANGTYWIQIFDQNGILIKRDKFSKVGK